MEIWQHKSKNISSLRDCFTDFGPGFTVLDTNGENPHAGMSLTSSFRAKSSFLSSAEQEWWPTLQTQIRQLSRFQTMIRFFFLMQVFAQITVKYSFQVEFGIGEWVTFKGVEGMTQLNGVEVKV
jgi:hypothetical protein